MRVYDPSDWGYTPSQDFRITMKVIPLLLFLFIGLSFGYTQFSSAQENVVDQVMDEFGGTDKVTLKDAYARYMAGDYTQAVKIASRVAYDDPQNALAYHILGLSHAKRGLTEEAAFSFGKAVELDPDFALAWFNLGIVEERRGDYQRAFEAYGKAQELEPKNPRYVEAFERTKRTIIGVTGWDRTHNESENLFMQGIEAVNSDNPEDYIYAENVFRTLLLDRPYDVATRNMLGYALARQGRLDEAEANFTQVVEIEPGFSEAWFNLGTIHRSQGRLEEALTEFETAYSSSSVQSFRDAVAREIDLLKKNIEQ